MLTLLTGQFGSHCALVITALLLPAMVLGIEKKTSSFPTGLLRLIETYQLLRVSAKCMLPFTSSDSFINLQGKE